MPKRKRAVERVLPAQLAQSSMFAGLDDEVLAIATEHGEFVEVALNQQIYEPEELIREVYFPTDSVLSIVSRMKDGSQIEVGTIGREGMSALPLLMGASSTANDCYCQVPGNAIKLSVDSFLEISHSSVGFRQRLDRYLQAYVNMLGQLAACNRLHSIYERCSRWLLMTHDRVASDEIHLTHEYLAMMLGTGRSGVSIAAGTLQQAGFIRYAHGIITIVNRAGLEDAACECYEVAREQFGGRLRSQRPTIGWRNA